jgi:AraC-like DNA-binding protein
VACRGVVPAPLEAESMALMLARSALGERAASGTAGKRKLVERAKLVLASDLVRRWTLADVAAEVGVSPAYLTQLFKQVEGMPLYRYQCACGWHARWNCWSGDMLLTISAH